MMKNTLAALVLIGIFGCSNSSAAEEGAYNPRKGFTIGFGLGGGGMSIHDGDFNKGAFLGNFRIGGGINEKIILLGETLSSTTSDHGSTVSISNILLSAQLFVYDNIYVRPGMGLGFTSVSDTVGSTTLTSTSDVGFSMLVASGYEFRLTKSFVLAPEVVVNFGRVEGANILNYGALLGLTWYL